MKQSEFAYRIRQALDEGADRIDYTVQVRLEKSREAALARQRSGQEAVAWVPTLQTAGAGNPQDRGDPQGWLRRLGLWAPLLVLLVGFVLIYQWHHDRSIAELANIDFAVLLDEAPLEAYADKGFGVFLQDEQPPPTQ